MSKHIIDKPKKRDDGARTKAYTKIERESGAGGESEQVQTLRRQPRTRDDGHRAAEYTKIERTEGDGEE
ncbi:hypothetical protein H0I76_02355 [Limibaculum sp. M0105]|uniref:Uncharacterized protein n=1 Tax=Thermohalobaculum xanthum TaxID=2753746 RepID=A0A8J7M4A9_9RHOB|nr:hypothetical protein [Thermohalobaculum xanthum]MBK0398020.1 hypothetical protein [Thermohalobaculum xanthum]